MPNPRDPRDAPEMLRQFGENAGKLGPEPETPEQLQEQLEALAASSGIPATELKAAMDSEQKARKDAAELVDLHAFLDRLGCRGKLGEGCARERLASLLGDYYDGKPLPGEDVIMAARFGGPEGEPAAPLRRPIGVNRMAKESPEEGVPEIVTPTQKLGRVMTYLEKMDLLQGEHVHAVRRLAGFPPLDRD